MYYLRFLRKSTWLNTSYLNLGCTGTLLRLWYRIFNNQQHILWSSLNLVVLQWALFIYLMRNRPSPNNLKIDFQSKVLNFCSGGVGKNNRSSVSQSFFFNLSYSYNEFSLVHLNNFQLLYYYCYIDKFQISSCVNKTESLIDINCY